MTETMRIMIAAEHLLFGESLALTLEIREGMDVVALPLEVNQSINAVMFYQPTVVLIDFNLENDRAFELSRLIRTGLSSTKIILFSLACSEQVILKCTESGADGYLSKSASLDELVAAIHSVCRGEKFCSPQITYILFTKLTDLALSSNNEFPQYFNLSPREIEVLRLVGSGLSNKQVAHQLKLSLYTVKNHVHNILEKLQVNNRSGIIRYAFHNKLINIRKN